MPDPTPRRLGNGYPADWRRMNIWMPVALYDRLDAATGRTEMSAFVRDAVEEKLDDVELAKWVASGRRDRARIAADGGASIR